jgi:hypothetical protein
MAATQNMPYFDIYLSDKLNILSRIVWFYDSSGVQAKKYFGSLYGSPEQRVIIKAYHEKQAKKRFRILSKFINP